MLELTNDKNENIVTYIKFEKFYRGKNIINKIYIIMDNYMKENFYNEDITQYFLRFYILLWPPNSKNLKLFELLGFDNEIKKLY